MERENIFKHILGCLLFFAGCVGAIPAFAATISGVVYGSDGTTPITAGYVDIYSASGGPCDPVTYTYVDSAVIASDGSYSSTIEPTPGGIIPVGHYYLKAVPYDNHVSEWWTSSNTSSPDCSNADFVDITDGAQTVTSKNFQLDPGATISGTVKDNLNVPVTVGGGVEVYSGNPCSGTGYVGLFFIDEVTGAYSVIGLPAGSYYLQAFSNGNHIPEWWVDTASSSVCSAAQAVIVVAAGAVTGIDFQLDIGATISGTVTDTAVTPAPITGGGFVEAYTGDPCGTYTLVGVASIDLGDATYSIGGLPVGTYYLKAYPTGNYTSEWWADPASTPICGSAGVVSVGTTGQTVSNVNFQLPAGATISGTVFDSSGTAPIAGRGSVIAYGASCGNSAVGFGAIGDNGVYTVSGLPAGTYYLKAVPIGSYLAEWWADPASVSLCGSAEAIPVGSLSVTTGKDFQLDTAFMVSTTVTPQIGGIITGGGTYLSGSTATLTAIAATGHTFANWSSTATAIADPAANPLGFTVSGDTTIVAHFDRIPYQVTTSVLPAGGGTVTGGNTTYLYGDTATLTAIPAHGYIFIGWSGDITATTNPLGFPVYTTKNIVANFEPKKHISFPVRAQNGKIVIIFM